MKNPAKLPLFVFVASHSLFAGPVTTVPWNGHTGAVSFTYDDARTSQIPNLLPQLDALKIKATFFIAVTGTGGDFEAKKSSWIQNAKNGHELANHTKAHVNVPADPSAAPIIQEMAKYLRDLDPVVESVTFAYPNCNVNGKTGIGAENFVSRSCGQTTYAWDKQPTDWMGIQGLILTPGSAGTAVSLLGTAKTGNSWAVTIVHDVKDNPDQYSLTPADNKKMLDAGVSNNLWIDTFEKVAAYYRAHFVMDAVTANPTNAGWSLTWTSPHPKMPKSVMLRVKLASAPFGNSITVQQGGTTIPAESDGSYVIDFMKLSMTVLQGTTGIPSKAILPDHSRMKWTPDGIDLGDVLGDVAVTVTNIQGVKIFQGMVTDHLVPLHREVMTGVLLVHVRDPLSNKSIHSMVQAVLE